MRLGSCDIVSIFCGVCVRACVCVCVCIRVCGSAVLGVASVVHYLFFIVFICVVVGYIE